MESAKNELSGPEFHVTEDNNFITSSGLYCLWAVNEWSVRWMRSGVYCGSYWVHTYVIAWNYASSCFLQVFMERLSHPIVAAQPYKRHMVLRWRAWFLQSWCSVRQKWNFFEVGAYCFWETHMRLFCPTETFCMEVTLVSLPIVDSKDQVMLTGILPNVMNLFWNIITETITVPLN